MDPLAKETIAIHFQILKQVWDQWSAGENPILPDATESFFTGITGRYFNEAMHTTLQGQKAPFSNLSGSLSAEESWKQMRAYFNKERPRAEYSILDSIFAEALAHSGKKLSDALTSDLREDVICLLGKYRQYCFTAVRDWFARERFPSTGKRWKTDSGNAPVGEEESEGGREIFDTIREPASAFTPDEEAEFLAIARSRSKERFSLLGTTQRAGLFAIYARNCAGVKLRFDDPAIAGFVKLSEGQFYEARKIAQVRHIEDFQQTDLWKREHPDARQRLEELLLETLLEESALWFAEEKPELVATILGDRLQAIAQYHSRECFEAARDTEKAALFCLYLKHRTGRSLSRTDPLLAKWAGESDEWDPESGTRLLDEHLRRFRKSANWFAEADACRTRIEELLRETLLEESFLWFSRKNPEHLSSLKEHSDTTSGVENNRFLNP